MREKHEHNDENNDLQNQFTKYLVTAIQNRKKNVLKSRDIHMGKEVAMCEDLVEDDLTIDVSGLKMPPRNMDDIEFQNEMFEQAILGLNERERYILFGRVLAERSFEELGSKLGLSYKGVAAVYYRTMKKIRTRVVK